MHIIENGGVTAAKGYCAAGACAGIKKKKEKAGEKKHAGV